MKATKKVLWPLAVLLVGGLIMVTLVKTRPTAARKKPAAPVTWVEVMRLAPQSHEAIVRGSGVVRAARELMLQPEVSGRVVRHHPQLVPGGMLQAGDEAVGIDDRDYKLMLTQQRQTVAGARYQLKVEKGRSVVAAREWELLEGSDDASAPSAGGKSLALRKPQLDSAKASVSAARSTLERAQLALERTSIVVPFNAVVLEERIEIGQLIGPQTVLARLAGTDRFWVQVSLPLSQLGTFALPSPDGERGAAVEVAFEVGGEAVSRSGEVVRLLGDLDPQGRMARVLVAVDDPLALARDDVAPMLLGTYAQVRIRGERLDGVYRVPRQALRNGDRVWIMTDDDALAIRDVEIAWRERDAVFVSGGLSEGDRLVLSSVSTPVPGMTLGVVGQSPSQAEEAAQD